MEVLMKNFILALMCVFLLTGCSKNGSITVNNENTSTEILTLMSSKSTSLNKIWIGTFQLVFNNLKNEIIKHDIKFANEAMTDDLRGLNSEEFNSSMLNDESYYTSTGETSPEAKNKIKADIKAKFNETSDIIDSFDWTKAPGNYYAYAMLKKEFEFLKVFDVLNNSPFNNSEKQYKYFGIKKHDEKHLSSNVRVLFYNNKDNYAVRLNTKNNDEVYLYRTDDNSDFKTLFSKMQSDNRKYEGSYSFSENDSLKIPYIKIDTKRNYKELCNKSIEGSDFQISAALETIKLELTEKGGKVKSEAIMMLENAAFEEPKEAREFNFDKTFVIFLVDSGKDDPYLALRIGNLDEFQK